MWTRDARAALNVVRDTRPSVEHGAVLSNADGYQSVRIIARTHEETDLPPVLSGDSTAGTPVLTLRMDQHQDPWVISWSPWQTSRAPQVIDL